MKVKFFVAALAIMLVAAADASACPLLSRIFKSRGACGSSQSYSVPAPQPVPTQAPVITTASATAPSCATGQCGNQAFQIERPRLFRLFR